MLLCGMSDDMGICMDVHGIPVSMLNTIKNNLNDKLRQVQHFLCSIKRTLKLLEWPMKTYYPGEASLRPLDLLYISFYQ